MIDGVNAIQHWKTILLQICRGSFCHTDMKLELRCFDANHCQKAPSFVLWIKPTLGGLQFNNVNQAE